MELAELVKLITESGMGLVAFAAVLYLAYRLLNWLEEVRTNHLPHLQTALDKQTEHLETINNKLDKIDENTRPKI